MSGASTFRNAVKRVTHKERAQPEARKKLGLLEKHKDYVIRAKDFHKKQDYIKTLKKKAAERNPDEFYHNMHNSQVVNGKHRTKTDNSLDNDEVKLLKTQDLGYIVYKKSIDDAKIEKLQSNLHLIGKSKAKNHTIFVDSVSEVENFDAVSVTEKRRAAGATRKDIDDVPVTKKTKKHTKKLLEASGMSYKELEERSSRSGKLGKALIRLQLQKDLMGKGRRTKIFLDEKGNKLNAKKRPRADEEGDDEEARTVVYKWKRERK